MMKSIKVAAAVMALTIPASASFFTNYDLEGANLRGSGVRSKRVPPPGEKGIYEDPAFEQLVSQAEENIRQQESERPRETKRFIIPKATQNRYRSRTRSSGSKGRDKQRTTSAPRPKKSACKDSESNVSDDSERSQRQKKFDQLQKEEMESKRENVADSVLDKKILELVNAHKRNAQRKSTNSNLSNWQSKKTGDSFKSMTPVVEEITSAPVAPETDMTGGTVRPVVAPVITRGTGDTSGPTGRRAGIYQDRRSRCNIPRPGHETHTSKHPSDDKESRRPRSRVSRNSRASRRNFGKAESSRAAPRTSRQKQYKIITSQKTRRLPVDVSASMLKGRGLKTKPSNSKVKVSARVGRGRNTRRQDIDKFTIQI